MSWSLGSGAEGRVDGALAASAGGSSARDFNQARTLLTALDVVTLGGSEIAIHATGNFRTQLVRGVTIRKVIDTLIATQCIESDYALRPSDRDCEAVCGLLSVAFGNRGD